ncbi:la-related protein 1B-like [Planoprotostelium fungivorum]|uniref:La-related protein 1B-like n=1 Tax=Planoprotostelium fungivorum TaxID=1890364 RepID=A0A2P6NP17_9EUKA|nr:la-related protein 1B-like [Planoprotostelium fungivorum]
MSEDNQSKLPETSGDRTADLENTKTVSDQPLQNEADAGKEVTDLGIWPTLDQAAKSPEAEGAAAAKPDASAAASDASKKTNWVPMKGIAGATPHRQQNQVQGFVSTRGSGGRRPRNQEQKEGEAESTEEGSGDRAFTKGGRNRGNNRRGRLKGRGGRGQQRGGAVVPGTPGTRTIPATQMTAPTGYPVAPYLVTEESIREALQQQIEYYFSIENLCKDIYLRQHMDLEGWVPISVIAGFQRIQALSTDPQLLLDVSTKSTVLDVNGDKLRPKVDWKTWIIPGAQEPTNNAPATTPNTTSKTNGGKSNQQGQKPPRERNAVPPPPQQEKSNNTGAKAGPSYLKAVAASSTTAPQQAQTHPRKAAETKPSTTPSQKTSSPNLGQQTSGKQSTQQTPLTNSPSPASSPAIVESAKGKEQASQMSYRNVAATTVPPTTGATASIASPTVQSPVTPVTPAAGPSGTTTVTAKSQASVQERRGQNGRREKREEKEEEKEETDEEKKWTTATNRRKKTTTPKGRKFGNYQGRKEGKENKEVLEGENQVQEVQKPAPGTDAATA